MSAALRLYAEVAGLVQEQAVLHDFAPFDADAPEAGKPPHQIPALPMIAARTAPEWDLAGGILSALIAAVPDLHWKQTYTEAEVGRDFLNAYGYIELVGPDGQFRSDWCRAYLGYWGPGMVYDWHHHRAEEMYLILAGSALFQADGLADAVLTPGQHRAHHADQPHAMTMGPDGLLALALWRGDGIDGLPLMGRAEALA